MAIILASLPLLSAAPPTSIPKFEVPKFNLPKLDPEPLLTAHRKLSSSNVATLLTASCNANTFESVFCPSSEFVRKRFVRGH